MLKTMQTDLQPGTESRFVTSSGIGSGVLISPDGKVLTAAHVVHTADSVGAVFQDGQLIPARVLSSAPFADVALVQLERMPENAVPVRLGDSDRMAVGDEVFVVGAPYGISHTLTAGHISSRHTRKALLGNLEALELFQTDASINMGNSGGPLFNMDGEVIGVVSHILSQSGGSEGLGFAVTAHIARRLLLEQKAVWTGIDFFPLTGSLAQIFNLPQEAGLLVQRVAAQSIAEALGLQPGKFRARIEDSEMLVGGDIILAAGDLPITGSPDDAAQILPYLRSLKKADVLRVKVLRSGKTQELSCTIP
jgi:S1-C subfamily serine protease